MNASRFMDKQIMDLSRSSKTDTNNNNPDFIDLMNPQSEEEGEDQQQQHEVQFNDGLINKKKQQENLPNYDFHPIHRPHSIPTAATSYSSLNHAEPEKIVLEKAQKVNDSAILSEIDRTMKTHTDTLMHAFDSLSARFSQMESRTRQLEHSVDDLKISVANNHGSNDGKLRQLENILLQVKTGVQDLKDKQDVFEGYMQLAKLQISKAEQSAEPQNSVNQNPVQQATASAPPQHSGFQQFAIPVSQPHSSMVPPNALPPSQQNIHTLPMASQFPLATTPSGSHHDTYLQLPAHTPDTSSNLYQISPAQNQQQAPPASLSHQYQPGPTPPYPQPPQPPQEQHPSTLGPIGHRPDESANAPSQAYLPNLYQPTSQPSSGPLPMQTYYGGPSPMYEPPPPPPARSGSGFQSSYVPPSGPSEPFSYSGHTSHYGGGPPLKPQPHSPRGGAGGYPQLPTARVLPQAIPSASGISGGSSSGGSGKVPIDDVVDKVTNMGFSRDQVRATVRRLTENGQSVDLNIVLDKLMNDSDVQPPKGWFGR